MFSLLFAGAELANAIENWRKVVALSRTVADLASQGEKQSPMSQDLIDDIVAASAATLAPFPVAKAQVRISSVGLYPNGSTTAVYVCSSAVSTQTPGTTPRPVGLAPDIQVAWAAPIASNRYIYAEITMEYTTMLGTAPSNLVKALKTDFTWREKMLWPVRGGQAYDPNPHLEVVMPRGSPCPPQP